VVLLILNLVWRGPFFSDDDFGFGTWVFGFGLFSIVSWVVQSLMHAGIVRGASEIAQARKPQIGTMFSTDQLGNVLLAGVILGVLTGIGLVLLVIPGLIVIFYTQFTMFFVVQRGLGAVDAIKASASLVSQNVGTLVGFFFAALLVYVIGLVLCGIGLLVAIPVIILAQTYTYFRLQGEPVAA
jgi:uncharacterized membrane protein